MELASSCLYCSYIFTDEERVCPRCGANREEAPPEPRETGSMQDVIQLLQKKRKVDAIKLYRKIHDVGLREAKKAIDKLEKDLP